MEQQLTMYDAILPVPAAWDCVETCRHFGEKVDYPDWWRGKARCLLGDWYEIEFDNRAYICCRRYEAKGELLR